MSYPKVLSDAVKNELASVLDRMSTMAQGESLTLNGTPSMIRRIRVNLYTYLRLEHLKALYTIKQLTHEEIVILKKDSLTLTISSSESSTMTPELKTIFEAEFLFLETVEEARSKAQKMILDNKISIEDSLTLLAEWRRVQG